MPLHNLFQPIVTYWFRIVLRITIRNTKIASGMAGYKKIPQYYVCGTPCTTTKLFEESHYGQNFEILSKNYGVVILIKEIFFKQKILVLVIFTNITSIGICNLLHISLVEE